MVGVTWRRCGHGGGGDMVEVVTWWHGGGDMVGGDMEEVWTWWKW